jgi:hypothetical protein
MEEKKVVWPVLVGNMLIWMNFVTCAWELKKAIISVPENPSYQFEMKDGFKVAGLENKQSKITMLKDKEKMIFTYEPCSKEK